jgi:hypothetical protein
MILTGPARRSEDRAPGLLARAGVDPPPARTTAGAIRGDAFLINGRPTREGRAWRGRSVEGLPPNARPVQGVFDDLNPETRAPWAYPDTGRWDPERNTREFRAAMPDRRRHGPPAFTVDRKGGSPQGYTQGRQPWHNPALTSKGDLRSRSIQERSMAAGAEVTHRRCGSNAVWVLCG